MASRFNVPFLPDHRYVRFLADHSEALAAVHFPLHPESSFDARHAEGEWDTADLATHLAELKGPSRFALLNSRIAPSSCYRDTKELRNLAGQLDNLLDAGLLDGIVIADFFLLQALSAYSPEIAASLEAVPSVNCLLSCFDRISAFLEVINASRFRLPSKIPLAPALNRQPHLLRETVTKCRKAFPEIKIELLVNEGCLFQCPFKLSHDAGIAFNCLGEGGWSMSRGLGCFAALRNTPSLLFKSPFIRPEDLYHYRQIADIFKICGRTLGPEFLRQTVAAYLREKHPGNLLRLFDAMDWLAGELCIDNTLLPAEFLQTLSSCDKRCASCTTCRDFLLVSRRPLRIHLEDFRFRRSWGD